MGWRDINMNRRKTRIDVAVVPMAQGEERAAAVLRKAVAAALACVAEQGRAEAMFTAGYVAGFARHQALKHGVDAEADGGVALLAALAAQVPDVVQALQLVPRVVPSSRAALAADGFGVDLLDLDAELGEEALDPGVRLDVVQAKGDDGCLT